MRNRRGRSQRSWGSGRSRIDFITTSSRMIRRRTAGSNRKRAPLADRLRSNNGCARGRGGEGEFGGGAAERAGGVGEGAGQKSAAAARRVELSVIDDDAAARQYRDRPAGEAHPLIGGVADIVVDLGGADRHLALRVPDRDVGVAADRDRPLPRVEAIELGVVGRGQRDKAVEVDPPLADTLGKQQGHAQFYAGYAVGGVLEGG